MYRHRPTSRELSLDEIEDARDLRAVIAAALATDHVDEESLRRGVWTYVRAERDAGTSPAFVIVALTELVDAATIQHASVRQFVTRQVILWCVEAYFGYLGGEVVGGGADALSANQAVPGPMIVSNR
jgi:hypothetical protein